MGNNLKMTKAVRKIALLGDSIFDNAIYVPDGPPVSEALQVALGQDWQVTLLAHDGDMVQHIFGQVQQVPQSTEHIVVSVGGNDALRAASELPGKLSSMNEALSHLSAVRSRFHQAYGDMLRVVCQQGARVTVCTVYDAVPGLSKELQTALSVFNDTITRIALRAGVGLIDLRSVCTDPADYSDISPIEPSVQGGRKIAQAISNRVASLPDLT